MAWLSRLSRNSLIIECINYSRKFEKAKTVKVLKCLIRMADYVLYYKTILYLMKNPKIV